MPTFVFIGHDKPNSVDLRMATRPAHVEWVKTLGDRMKMAGGMRTDDDSAPLGSVIVIEADTLADAKATFAADPYANAGLWETTEVRPIMLVSL